MCNTSKTRNESVWEAQAPRVPSSTRIVHHTRPPHRLLDSIDECCCKVTVLLAHAGGVGRNNGWVGLLFVGLEFSGSNRNVMFLLKCYSSLLSCHVPKAWAIRSHREKAVNVVFICCLVTIDRRYGANGGAIDSPNQYRIDSRISNRFENRSR